MQIANSVFEIISADSVQVYRYLDIGSGKPTIEQRNHTTHYLIDVVDPDYWFTAGQFCKLAFGACEEVYKKNRIPLFVGGTPFYINSFFLGLSSIPAIDKSIRQQLIEELGKRGVGSLYRELLEYDNIFASKIHFNDKQRILRGIEVYRSTARPISSFYNQKKGFETKDTLYIGLYQEKDILHRRIDNRVDKMIRTGFVDEVINIRSMGFGSDLNSMKSIGYNELNYYIDGKLALEEAIDNVKANTKKYAKRQMTWFRKNKRIHWFTSFEVERMRELIDKWLDTILLDN